MREPYKLSVRALVEHVYRSGSIETGAGAGLQASWSEGTKAHKRIQDTYQEPDQKEVQLSGSCYTSCGQLEFALEGRCDGVRYEGEKVIIEEIKSTSSDVLLLQEAVPVHLAQALCYAYLYAQQHQIRSIGVRILYTHIRTMEEKVFQLELELAELERECTRLLDLYKPYAEQQTSYIRDKLTSIEGLDFPHPSYRAGQRHLAGAVYQAISEGKKLFARAPTGTGKTISTLFPAVKAVGTGLIRRIVYITARTTTRKAAEGALRQLKDKGLKLRSVTLTAKEKICFQDEMVCNKEACPYADGYYDRINEALLNLWQEQLLVDREIIENYAKKFTICPFEFSLDAAYAADVIIGDYNYIFDPRIALRRLLEEDKRRTAVLVDEAHNLVDRAREMYSAQLEKVPFLHASRTGKLTAAKLGDSAKAINRFFIDHRKTLGVRKSQVSPNLPEEIVPLLEGYNQAAEELLAAGSQSIVQQDSSLVELYYKAADFIRVAGYRGTGDSTSRYSVITELDGNNVLLRLYCLDPSELLAQMVKGFRSVVYFSATFSPLGYYRQVLGAMEEDYSISIPSPFRKEQLQIEIIPLSTRYKDRQETQGLIIQLLVERFRKHKGNTMIFFPSYEYMLAAEELLRNQSPSARFLVQTMGMGEAERDTYLSAFTPDPGRPVVGLAILGGIFSEGVDLPGDRLSNVIIVGVGLPQVSLERDLMKGYYDRMGSRGYEFAYLYPGFNKVLQAAGRLIRSELDEGRLTLVDDRYLTPAYRTQFPDEWDEPQVVKTKAQEAKEQWFRLYE